MVVSLCQGTGRKSGELASGDSTGCPGGQLRPLTGCRLPTPVLSASGAGGAPRTQRTWVLLSHHHGRLHREWDKSIVAFLSLMFAGIADGAFWVLSPYEQSLWLPELAADEKAARLGGPIWTWPGEIPLET